MILQCKFIVIDFTIKVHCYWFYYKSSSLRILSWKFIINDFSVKMHWKIKTKWLCHGINADITENILLLYKLCICIKNDFPIIFNENIFIIKWIVKQLIDFNVMSICVEVFYAKWLRYCIHGMFILKIWGYFFSKFFFLLSPLEYESFSNKSIWSIDKTLRGKIYLTHIVRP